MYKYAQWTKIIKNYKILQLKGSIPQSLIKNRPFEMNDLTEDFKSVWFIA